MQVLPPGARDEYGRFIYSPLERLKFRFERLKFKLRSMSLAGGVIVVISIIICIVIFLPVLGHIVLVVTIGLWSAILWCYDFLSDEKLGRFLLALAALGGMVAAVGRWFSRRR